MKFICCLALFFIHLNLFAQSSAQDTGRQVVITIDDLPVVSLQRDMASQQLITRKILTTLKNFKVPAIGFVNEQKLYTDGQLDEQKAQLLRQWIDAGMELGNHSFSHPDYNNLTFAEFSADIKKGEPVTRQLLAGQGKTLRYFRHPFLHTGNTTEKKEQLENFLEENNYQPAPVTFDNSEWIFNRAYENAFLADDSTLMKKIGTAYIPYMEEKIAYFEDQSEQLFGYEIKQVLLLHANAINADYLDELLTMMAARGYTFIDLETALQDKAYQSDNTFTGNAGISWIHRWALAKGKKGHFFGNEPETPDFIKDVAKIYTE